MIRLITARAASAVGVLALAAAAFGLAIAPASAATSQCGSLCTSFYPLSTGTGDVLAVSHPSGTSASTGQAVTISAASTTNQGEDWVLEIQGTVTDFFEAGLISSAMNLHFGSDEVYEIDYAPDGTWTGKCLGVSSSNGSGSVTLQPCGVTAATLWAADTADQNGRAVPLINGNNNNFSAPFGLTASSVGSQLTSSGLRAPISLNSDWGLVFGVL
jgi:hypothetical protein